MTPELWQRLKPLYHAALEMPEEARARYVAEAGANDDELKKELITLLKASDERTGPGDAPIVNFKDFFPEEPRSFSDGELILGRFRNDIEGMDAANGGALKAPALSERALG